METASDGASTPGCPNTPDSDKSIAQRRSSFRRLSESDQYSILSRPLNELTPQRSVNIYQCRLQCTYKTSKPELIRLYIISTHVLNESEHEERVSLEDTLRAPPLRPASTNRTAGTALYVCILLYFCAIIIAQPWIIRIVWIFWLCMIFIMQVLTIVVMYF